MVFAWTALKRQLVKGPDGSLDQLACRLDKHTSTNIEMKAPITTFLAYDTTPHYTIAYRWVSFFL